MSDKTTATERLRTLLEKRGVEWDYGITGTATTRFNANGVDVTFAPMRDGLVCSTILTPEQAVEATLGRGTCKNVSDFPKYELVCSACGGRLDILDEFDNPTVQHADGSFGPRYCPSCGRRVEQ